MAIIKFDPTHAPIKANQNSFNNFKYLMKFLIAFASLLYVYAYDIAMSGTMCTCSKINYQADCNMMSGMCSWSGSACANYNCPTITSYSTCSMATTCAWVNNTCSTFTKCSDYSSSANATCSV